MSKLLLIMGFVVSMSMLGFAAANAGSSTAPASIVRDGKTLDLDLD